MNHFCCCFILLPTGPGWVTAIRLPCSLPQPADPDVSTQARRRDLPRTHGALLSNNLWCYWREDDVHATEESGRLWGYSWWAVPATDAEGTTTGKDAAQTLCHTCLDLKRPHQYCRFHGRQQWVCFSILYINIHITSAFSANFLFHWNITNLRFTSCNKPQGKLTGHILREISDEQRKIY